MTWLWKNGIPQLATSRQSPGKLSLTTGYQTLPDIVPQVEPTEGFRTLGVYITPSGNFSKQAKILRGHAEQFRDQLQPAFLTPSEAYFCYMMYVWPKIMYPFPCISLTEKQCRHIQAPVLEAILPKLRLNRHTPRAVLFAGPRYGGLNLAENYSDLGYGHLQYMVGHIKMEDEVGHMLLSLISHAQVQVGSTTPFFQLPYPSYHHWIDHTWVTDVWKFMHRAQIGVEIEKHWLPKLARQHDVALMDIGLTFNFDSHQLRCINACRMYLQVITLSDVVNAKGDKILFSVIKGQRVASRQSKLLWPSIPRPPQSFWNHWTILLQRLSEGFRLLQPLGPWVAPTHYDWIWYKTYSNIVWEHDVPSQQWFTYCASPPAGRRTRSSVSVYHFGNKTPSAPPEDILYPIDIVSGETDSFRIVSSAYTLVSDASTPPLNLWQHTTVPDVFSNTHPFFQHLLCNPLIAEECQHITTEIQEQTLAVCSDGACDIHIATASHGVVFASALLQQTIAECAGPVDGHPDLLTPYRAELSGIVATLYAVYRICQFFNITSGAMKLLCDNKGALTNAFKPIIPGITPYFSTDHDLLEVARSLITLIPIVITTQWVKRHYTGTNKKYEHTLNEAAEWIAGEFQINQTPHYSIKKPLAPPGYKIRVLYDSSVVTSKIKRVIRGGLHTAPIIAHIIML
jgi:hypothetical protein